MKATVIGLGLIGGSIALDLKKSGLVTHIAGIDLNSEHTADALKLGLVDEIVSSAAVKDMDLIVMAIPVSALVKTLPGILDTVPNHAVVIDAGSTKSQICKAVANHPKRAQFVASHPIAGTENSGPAAAFSGLFRNKTNIICERELTSPAALEVALKVFDALGMNTIFMEPGSTIGMLLMFHTCRMSVRFCWDKLYLTLNVMKRTSLTWRAAVSHQQCVLRKARRICGHPYSNKMPSTSVKRCLNTSCTCSDFSITS